MHATEAVKFITEVKASNPKVALLQAASRIDQISALRRSTIGSARIEEEANHLKERRVGISLARERALAEIDGFEKAGKILGVPYFEIRNAIDLIRECRNQDDSKSLSWWEMLINENY